MRSMVGKGIRGGKNDINIFYQPIYDPSYAVFHHKT